VENKEYEKAFAQIDMLQKNYPNKAFILWFLGQAQMENQRYQEAIEAYQKLLQTLTSSPYYHPEGEVECRYYLAKAYYGNKDWTNCSVQLDSILQFNNHPKKNKHIKDFIGKSKDLKKKIEKETNTG
jgi:tetratricopeptide (TPR) repeat protein